MIEETRVRRGGCLCGAVRYEAVGEPLYSGLCFCEDCRRASGGGSVGYMGIARHGFRVLGETQQVRTALKSGKVATRNICPTCGSLVFGGELGVSEQINIYAGTLDDPSQFRPTHAIMTRAKPEWAPIPEGLTVYQGMPE